jgi:hypothetical protein
MGSSTDEYLLTKYLSDPMESYFIRKMPEVDREVVLARVAECLKGLSLMNPDSGNILFSDQIDTVWHLWILQTEQYAKLCAKLPGGQIRHHSSADYPCSANEASDADSTVNRIICFFALYVRNFGPIDDSRLQYWPRLGSLMQVLGWDLARTNAYLYEKADELGTASQQIGTDRHVPYLGSTACCYLTVRLKDENDPSLYSRLDPLMSKDDPAVQVGWVLPVRPAATELSDEDLEKIAGGGTLGGMLCMGGLARRET